jgi:hypothetical protein
VKKRAKCTEAVEQVVHLAELARKRGLLAFDLYETDNLFLSKMLRCVVDGLDKKTIREMMEVELVTSGKKGAGLLELTIYLEGILAILNGDNPRVIRDYLEGFIGEDALIHMRKKQKGVRYILSETLEEKLRETIRQQADANKVLQRKVDQQRNTILCLVNKGIKCNMSECPDFKKDENAEDTETQRFEFEDIAGFRDYQIQRLLREVSRYDLALALKISSKYVKKRIFENLSVGIKESFEEDTNHLENVQIRDAELAQQKIVDTIIKLNEEGWFNFPFSRYDCDYKYCSMELST